MKIFLPYLLVILLVNSLQGLVHSTAEEDFTSEVDSGSTGASEPLECPDGFTNLNDHCYHFSASGQTWFNAMKVCISLGAHLASLETLSKNENVKSHLRDLDPLKKTDWWISGTDDSQEGVFVWINSMQLVEYTDWCPNDPNNYYDESCVHLVGSCDYKWQERSCDYSTRYICEV